MRVVLLPSNVDGSGCYRCLLPGRELRLQRGWDARMAPHRLERSGANVLVVYEDGDRSIDRWLLETDFDVLVWGQRGEPWTQVLSARLRAQGKRVLVDSDDAWWGLPAWNPGSRRPAVEVQAMRRQLAAADGLSVATPALAELYEPYQPNVRVIRNRLDWWMWSDVTPVYEQERRHVRVGWIGDSKWRRGDLDVLKPWLAGWLERNPNVEFVAAGDPAVHDHLGIPPGQRVSTNSVEFYNFDLADITAVMDIGLVPLDLSTPEARRLNECKSHLKGLEYNACGIPFVATPTESYMWYVGAGGVGELAGVAKEWAAALDVYVNEAEWRLSSGKAARAAAERHTLNDISEWEDWIAGRSLDPIAPGTREPAAAGVGER